MQTSLAQIIDMNIQAAGDKITARNIRHRRWMLGVSRNLLGFKIGVFADEIEELESGERHIDVQTLAKIAVALDVSMAELTSGFDVDECSVAGRVQPEIFRLAVPVGPANSQAVH